MTHIPYAYSDLGPGDAFWTPDTGFGVVIVVNRMLHRCYCVFWARDAQGFAQAHGDVDTREVVEGVRYVSKFEVK